MSTLDPVRLAHSIEQALAIIASLDAEPRSVRELGEAAGTPRSTTHRHLHALVAIGKARRVKGGWITTAAPTTSPDETSDPPAPTPISSKRRKRAKRKAPVDFTPNGSQRCEQCNRSLETFGGRTLPCSCTEEVAA